VIRATTALLPAGIMYRAGQVLFANASIWPGDPDVIRLDRNMADPRRDEAERLLDLFFATVDDFADPVTTDPVPYLDARFQYRARVPETQTSLF